MLVVDGGRVGLDLLVDAHEHLVEHALAQTQRALLKVGLDGHEDACAGNIVANRQDHQPQACDDEEDELAQILAAALLRATMTPRRSHVHHLLLLLMLLVVLQLLQLMLARILVVGAFLLLRHSDVRVRVRVRIRVGCVVHKQQVGSYRESGEQATQEYASLVAD